MHADASETFVAEFGNEAFNELFETFYDRSRNHPDNKFTITNVETINACNHLFSATYNSPNGMVYITAENGDFNGSNILKWSMEQIVHEPFTPVYYSLMPIASINQAMFNVFLLWRNEAWFADLVRGYNYDRFFQPGVVVENHYINQARKRGLKFAPIEVCEEYIKNGPVSEKDRKAIDDLVSSMLSNETK